MTAGQPLRVAWIGLRGFPGVQGGVETHAQQLCPRLAALGCDVRVYARRGYQDERLGPAWQGVRFRVLWAPRHKHLEAVVHTFLALTWAGLVDRPDVVHLQAIGPALFTPWARLLGLRVVVTHHGEDYRRQKWGPLARTVLRLGEAAAVRFGHRVIAISRGIRDLVAAQGPGVPALIPNGIDAPGPVPGVQALHALGLGLEPGRYVLTVGRLVEEKRHLDLIEAFARARPPGWRLVLVGAADHADGYARELTQAAQRNGAVMAGFRTGEALHALYAHAGLFVLPSSHEGLPIALLEALSHGLPVLASDIAPHQELGLPDGACFPLGDVAALAAGITRAAQAAQAAQGPAALRAEDWEAQRRRVLARFSWDRAAQATMQVYRRVCAGAPRPVGRVPKRSLRPSTAR